MFCREQAASWAARQEELEQRQVSLVFIGNGTAAQAANFRSRYAPRATVLTDPLRRVYQALEFRRSVFGILHPRLWLNFWRAFRRGFRQQGTEGDALQLGGYVLVDVTGRVVFQYRERVAGDVYEMNEAKLQEFLGR